MSAVILGVLFGFSISLISISGMVFCLYWPAYWFSVSSGRDYANRPLALYWIAFGFTLLSTVMLFVILFVMSCIFSLLILGAGLVGWGVLLFEWWGGRSMRESRKAMYRRRNIPLPPKNSGPKPQLWMQDLFIAVMLYGLVLVVMLPKADTLDYGVNLVVVSIAYYFLSGALGLWVFTDIFRRIETPLTPKTRGLHFVPLFLVFLIALPLGWIAWRVWQRLQMKFHPGDYEWPPLLTPQDLKPASAPPPAKPSTDAEAPLFREPPRPPSPGS